MSDFLLDAVELSADRCIKCNVCNSACPVMPATDLFPGPKYCGPQAQRFRIGGPVEEWVDYCSGCGACTRACPSGVKAAELNSRARARVYDARGRIPLRNRLLSSSELLGRLGSPFAPLSNVPLRVRPLRVAIEKGLKIHRDAPIPSFSRPTFRARFGRLPRPFQPWMRVAYFHGCSTNYYEPMVGVATVQALARFGVDVDLPAQNCCGLPFISNGDFKIARRYAEANIRKLLPAARAGLKIVGTSTSCTYAIRREYHEVLGIDTPELHEVSAAVHDVFEFLRESVWTGRIEQPQGLYAHRVLYHPPCQLRSHGVGVPVPEVLSGLSGLDLSESGVECCGIAGTYGLKLEKFDIAQSIGRPIANLAARSRVDQIASDSETCRWHLAEMSGLPAVHPIQILEEATRPLV